VTKLHAGHPKTFGLISFHLGVVHQNTFPMKMKH